MDKTTLTGPQVKRLMRVNGKTIRGLSASMNITQKRVRYVREHGVRGECFVRDWLEALTSPSTQPTATAAIPDEPRQRLAITAL